MDEIGGQLREARMRQKIDINEVEVRTKIRAKYLRAMENEEWDLLPGEVYVRSFLRTYAEFLGLDARALLDEFRRRYENPADHEQVPIAPPGRDRRERERGHRRSVGIPSWAIVVVVIVIVGVVLYIVGTGPANKDHTTANLPRSTSTTTSHQTVHHRRHRHHRSTVTKASPKSVTLALTPTSAVWVCLVNGAGKTLIDGQTFNTGQTIPIETGHELKLLIGNSSVTVKVNGVAVPVPASSTPIGLAFTPRGHTSLSSANEPSCSS